jgi:hypothetical protein
MIAVLIIFGAVGLWIFGFFVGRNNPNMKVVNKLLADGKAVVDSLNKTIKKV